MSSTNRVILKNRPRGFRSSGLVIKDNQLLLMKQVLRGEVFYSVPGGHWEENETLEQTCQREIKEEFGIDVVVDRLIYYVDTESRLNFVFSCNYASGEITLGGPEGERMSENDQYFPLWLDLNEVESANIQPVETKEAIIRYLQDKKQPPFFVSNIKKLTNNVLIIAPEYITVPPKAYGGRERMAALAYDYYKKSGYEVDIISKEGSDYHTFSISQMDEIDFGKYRLIITYTYDRKLLEKLDKSGRRVFVILENNYADKLSFIKDLKRCECFVISKDQQKQYEQALGTQYDIKPNCIDMDLYQLNSVTQRDKDIIYIGAIGQHKSPLACLDYAIKHNLQIDFYGPLMFTESEESYKETFMTKLKSYQKARLLDEIGDAEKVNLLNQYKYFIFLAGLEKEEWTEPFGLAPLEALACGCTVITQFIRGGHLSFCTKENSISYEETPREFNAQSNRDSVKEFDAKRVLATYYPR